MRRLTAALWLAGVLLSGCNRRERMHVELVEEPFTLRSSIAMSDPRAAVQLVSGFHDIEQKAWRWSSGKFAVNLRPPEGSAQTGAHLVARFSIPEVSLQHLKAITLTAKTGSMVLGSETYSKAGEQVFRETVPAALLAGEGVVFRFELDRSLPAGSIDERELGVIVSSIGLEK